MSRAHATCTAARYKSATAYLLDVDMGTDDVRISYRQPSDRVCLSSDEPPTAAAIEAAGGAAGIVDNRFAYVGIDVEAARDQPFYRVQLREGRGHYCAQEHLSTVPLAEALRVPIRGTSFFFVKADTQSGRLVPRPELALRYPDDAAVRVEAG